ncbi:MAG: DUF6089 family protein [Bacteroidetes bacterium]|nr:DUF6089 family protein [Bacteroidota bacterium]
MQKLTLIFTLTVCSLASRAQSFEIGGMLGGSNYHGDLAYNIVANETQGSGGIFGRINFNEFWTMRPTISYLQISGADSNFSEYKLRNLSFRNNIYEISNVMELNFRPFSNQRMHAKTTVYALAGIAAFYHKPEAFFNNQWIALKPLHTEAKGYKTFQLAIPMGAGVKHAVNENIIVGFEVGWRKTFTDHLDDVSTVYPSLPPNSRTLSDRSWEVTEDGLSKASQGDMRGDPNLKDWYFQTAFTISYRFTPIKCPF